MRHLFLLFIGGFAFSSCESNMAIETDSEGLIDSRFETCYYENDLALKKCDSVLGSIFGSVIVNENIHLNLEESTMNCQVDSVLKSIPFGDENHCVPNSYNLLYNLNEGNETIYSFQMTAREDMQFEPISIIITDELLGYRKLLEGKFKINYSDAQKIAEANDADLEEAVLELVKDESSKISGEASYYWEAELEYDHNSVALLVIDVMTGETKKEVLTIENIK